VIVIRLPRPLSMNGLYYNHRSGGRSATLAHRNWRMSAMQEISAQRVNWPERQILGRYRLTLVVGRPDKGLRRGDLGNLEKCVSDVLTKMQVIRDDADAEEIILRWGDVAGCEVTIESLA
jgi:Holliday junction resolvase RusA-like endonuclease